MPKNEKEKCKISSHVPINHCPYYNPDCPICHTPPLKEKLQWRDNLHKIVRMGIYGKDWQKISLAQCIVDAIDAAYVQGLEDKAA